MTEEYDDELNDDTEQDIEEFSDLVDEMETCCDAGDREAIDDTKEELIDRYRDASESVTQLARHYQEIGQHWGDAETLLFSIACHVLGKKPDDLARETKMECEALHVLLQGWLAANHAQHPNEPSSHVLHDIFDKPYEAIHGEPPPQFSEG